MTRGYCQTICVAHKTTHRYTKGAKRCMICEVYMYWEGIFCPCCGTRLRGKPRGGKARRIFIANTNQ